MGTVLILKDMPDRAPDRAGGRTVEPLAGLARQLERRSATECARKSREAARARCAWLLAIDMAEKAVEGALFARIYSTPGKVGRGSDTRTALARKIACYLTATVGDCEAVAVGRAAGLHRKTVQTHLREIEDARDDSWIDQQLEDMGRRMVSAAAGLVMANLGDQA